VRVGNTTKFSKGNRVLELSPFKLGVKQLQAFNLPKNELIINKPAVYLADFFTKFNHNADVEVYNSEL
jgi:hypothetical protein